MASDDQNPMSPGYGSFNGLPSAEMQSHMHELAKTLPAPRRQNIACDACRARKVRCHQVPGQERCQHCITKNYPCTHHIQQATNERRKASGGMKKPKALNNLPVGQRTSPPYSSESSLSPSAASLVFSAPQNLLGSPLRGIFAPNNSSQLSVPAILSMLFSPDPSLDLARRPKYTEVYSKLEDEAFRAEFAMDLVEVYFQIVHTRQPLLNPSDFRTRLKQALDPRGELGIPERPINPSLLATILAWGAKFSEHPLLALDREASGNGSSRLAKVLIDRARDVAEAQKVHRVASSDNVVIGLLIEPLQSQNPDDPEGFFGFWITSAIRHLLELQINHKSVTATITEPEARGTMIFAWWMACIADAYRSAYYRRKPMLDDEDYDIDFYTADPVQSESIEPPTTSPREQLEFLGYYRAAHALARLSRNMSKQLWRPTTESEGLPFEILDGFVTSLMEWRDEYLSRVGVPNNFETNWDFLSAISACASDATYHLMWVVLFNAIDEYGVRESIDATREGTPPIRASNHAQIERIKQKLYDEALHGALRIAGLAGVLTSNGYLRLDPAVMHVSCIQSGTLLARLGRPEVSNCIEGLQQYSYAYVEAADSAVEMDRTYRNALAGESDFTHMSSIVLQPDGQSPMSMG